MEDQLRTQDVIVREILQSLNGCNQIDALSVLARVKATVEGNCYYSFDRTFAEAKLRG